MGKQTRRRVARACDNCSIEASTQFRINIGEGWKIVCKTCQSEAKYHSNYLYGGTWKQKKRN